MMKPPRLSREFLADLRLVVPAMQANSLSTEFLSDLAAAHDIVRWPATHQPIPREELKFVANHLEKWRLKTRQEVEERLRGLPKDDPILCPISLFGTMDYGRLETAHTRALAWLLDPSAEHGFGTKLAEALISKLAGKNFREFEVDRVEREYFIETSRKFGAKGRIDVFAEGKCVVQALRPRRWLLAIEAKIDAIEGEGQLAGYEEGLDQLADKRDVYLVFLSSENRRQPKTAQKKWTHLSFPTLVSVFREVFLAESKHRVKPPGYHYLRFYLAGVLKNVCRWDIPIKADCPDPYSVLDYLIPAK